MIFSLRATILINLNRNLKWQRWSPYLLFQQRTQLHRRRGCSRHECRRLLYQWLVDNCWCSAQHNRPRAKPRVVQPPSVARRRPWSTPPWALDARRPAPARLLSHPGSTSIRRRCEALGVLVQQLKHTSNMSGKSFGLVTERRHDILVLCAVTHIFAYWTSSVSVTHVIFFIVECGIARFLCTARIRRLSIILACRLPLCQISFLLRPPLLS